VTLVFTLRKKLLAASATIFLLPWAGYHYIIEIEGYLRERQEQQLLERAQLIAATVSDYGSWLNARNGVPRRAGNPLHWFVRRVKVPMVIDGYADDWQTYRRYFTVVRSPRRDFRFSYALAAGDEALYVFIAVHDRHRVYRSASAPALAWDAVGLSMMDRRGREQRYRIATLAPGWVRAQRLRQKGRGGPVTLQEVPIAGEWQETREGYNVELAVPFELLGDYLRIAVFDAVGEQTPAVAEVLYSAGDSRQRRYHSLALADRRVQRLLERAVPPRTRIRIVDRFSRVIAEAGDLTLPPEPPADDAHRPEVALPVALMRLFYRLILTQPASVFDDELHSASQLHSEEVSAALAGESGFRWRQAADQTVTVLSAAAPVGAAKQPAGAVLVEETNHSILLVQHRAMETLINWSVVAILVTVASLLWYATRLSSRVRQLSALARRAVSPEGRLRGFHGGNHGDDELGDLARTFADLLTRIQGYHHYLESMAGKLSHELRTPIAVVRSSLENLHAAPLGADQQRCVQRAREGIQRLSDILTRMSEATRLEKTIQDEEKVDFDLAALVGGCVQGYRLAYPDRCFVCDSPVARAVNIHGAPELIAQLLDKLVANAVDFAAPETQIRIALVDGDTGVTLSVENEGEWIPDEIRDSLFDSMVSLRRHGSNEPHLGLGLYIVRLIADFHGGRVAAENLSDPERVRMTLTLPRRAGL